MSSTHGIGPGGFRRRALLKVITSGNVITRRGGRRVEVDSSGKIVRRLGRLPLHRHSEPLFPRRIRKPPEASLLGAGWITYGIWHNDSGSPVTLFRTVWQVPEPPNASNGQAVMLFNGIQNGDAILQPVLQWGETALGGGNYWAVASWLAGPPGQVYQRSGQLVPVESGSTLEAVISITDGTPPGPYNYNCRFAGIDGTNLDIYGEDELTDCVETLEAYGVTTADDYPAGGAMTAMTGIQVQVGGLDATLDWQMVDAVTDCGEHADLVSNSSPGGEIDLYY